MVLWMATLYVQAPIAMLRMLGYTAGTKLLACCLVINHLFMTADMAVDTCSRESLLPVKLRACLLHLDPPYLAVPASSM